MGLTLHRICIQDSTHIQGCTTLCMCHRTGPQQHMTAHTPHQATQTTPPLQTAQQWSALGQTVNNTGPIQGRRPPTQVRYPAGLAVPAAAASAAADTLLRLLAGPSAPAAARLLPPAGGPAGPCSTASTTQHITAQHSTAYSLLIACCAWEPNDICQLAESC
jgi:hypothetical protein